MLLDAFLISIPLSLIISFVHLTMAAFGATIQDKASNFYFTIAVISFVYCCTALGFVVAYMDRFS